MKGKIAVFANGFSEESLVQAIGGIRKYAKEIDFDTFVFMSFASYSEHYNINRGELNIYGLGHMEDYDGIIIFSNHLNSPETAEKLCNEAKDKKIPVVSVGMPLEGVPSLCVSNEVGMRALVTHLVEDHGLKRFVFLAGNEGHPDSTARLETTKEVLKEHGLELKDEDIVYGDWGNNAARDIVHKFAESEDGLPDALLCANDIMALAAMTELTGMGYMLPDDIVVTGFDNISYGQNFYPGLTTVDQDFETIGYESCRLINDQINGAKIENIHLIPSRFVRAESCGCKDDPHYVELRKNYCRHSYLYHLDSAALEMYERVLRQRIGNITEYKALKEEMRRHYERNNIFEGKEFYIVINPLFFEDAVTSEAELFVDGYSDPMEAIVGFKDGQVLPDMMTDRHELIPGYAKKAGEQHVYYFLPLHYFQYNYGYMAFVDEPPILEADMLYPYLEKLQQSLKLLRINMRLDGLNKDLTRIYNRDPMTGLYNRLAYEEKAIALFEKSVSDKKPMMVMFVDINYMKRINDQYGHLHGDNAIKTVAESIKSVLKEDWIAVRFGGDEFLLIASDCDEDAAVQVRHSILSFLELKNNDGSQPYTISASCGFVITDTSSGMNLQDYVKEADNLMYKIKQEVHAKDGESRS